MTDLISRRMDAGKDALMSSALEATGSTLSVVETAKLENLEIVIEGGLQSFIEVGRALSEIRDGRLYRASHMTFEDYCQERWDMSPRHATRLAEAAAVIDQIGPIGPKPENESQARPLTRLPEGERVEAWKEALATAPNGKPTAAHVEEVVSKRLTNSDDETDDGAKPAKAKKPDQEARWTRESREFLEKFAENVKKVCDGAVYTTDTLSRIVGCKAQDVAWFVRLCEVSPAVKVHRTFGRKQLCQYTFEATKCVTGHARIKQLAAQISKDQASSSRIKAAADEILSLLGG